MGSEFSFSRDGDGKFLALFKFHFYQLANFHVIVVAITSSLHRQGKTADRSLTSCYFLSHVVCVIYCLLVKLVDSEVSVKELEYMTIMPPPVCSQCKQNQLSQCVVGLRVCSVLSLFQQPDLFHSPT